MYIFDSASERRKVEKRKIECLENDAMGKIGHYLVDVGKGN